MILRKRLVLWAILAVVLISALPDWGQVQNSVLPAPPKIKITATITSPGKFAAICPYTIKFTGTITASATCTVQYKFIRSDNAIMPVQTLHFLGAGSINVTDTWQLGATYVGWEAVQVTSPQSVTSNHGDFALVCIAKAAISKASLKCGGEPCNEIDVLGTGFGATQGARKLMVDGVAASSILNWSATSISMQITGFTLIYWDHVYQFSIQEGGNSISNIYSTRFPVKFDSITPQSGASGAVITLYAWGGGSQADGRVVKIGNYTCTVVSWTTNGVNAVIKVKVPAAPAGSYKIYIQRGADIISDQANFIII
jgi:hypothetical protein